MSNGFIYLASNNVGGSNNINYIQEAVFSAISLKRFHPSEGISIITDSNGEKYLKNMKNTKDLWDKIIVLDIGLRSKQDLLYDNTPYQKTVYIDTDTYINWNLHDLFKLLDNFDILGVSDYARKRNFEFFPEYNAIPDGFSEINGGLMAFRKNECVCEFFNNWKNLFNKYLKSDGLKWDQPSLRVAMWMAINRNNFVGELGLDNLGRDLKYYSLPIEYNRRSKDTKKKNIDLKKKGDKRFPKSHLRTRVYHFHGIQQMLSLRNGGIMVENKAQNF